MSDRPESVVDAAAAGSIILVTDLRPSQAGCMSLGTSNGDVLMASVEDILMVKGPDVITAVGSNTVREAAKMMAEGNVGSVVVKDGDDVSGIFTERDLLRRVVARGQDPETMLLSEVMSSPVKTCRLADDIHDLAERLTSEHIRHLAVVEDGALIGLIGLRDVMAAEVRELKGQ